MSKTMKLLTAFVCICMLICWMAVPVQASSYRVMVNNRMVEEIVPGYRQSPKTADKTAKVVATFSEERDGAIIPIALKSEGLLRLALYQNEGDGAYIRVEGDLFADEECTKKLGYSLDLYAGEVTRAEYEQYLAGYERVYLKLTVEKAEGVTDIRVRMEASLTRGGDASIKQGSGVLSAFDRERESSEYSIEVKKSGYLTVTVAGEGEIYAYLTLYDQKGKAISKEYCAIGEGTASKTYIIGKGAYRLGVEMKGARGEVYGISYQVEQMKDQSGKNKAKAVTLTGREQIGAITQGAKAGHTDWWKFTLKEAQEVAIKLNAVSDGEMMLYIADASGEGGWYGEAVIRSGEMIFDAGELPAGRYFVKVQKREASSGIGYTIALQQ